MSYLVPHSMSRTPVAKVEDALVESWGNIPIAARRLRVRAEDLRAMVWAMPVLVDAMLSGLEQALDEAEVSIFRGMRSNSPDRRLKAATFYLTHSPGAKRRGWGRDRGPKPEPEPEVNLVWRENA